jgi:hypothetical protein
MSSLPNIDDQRLLFIDKFYSFVNVRSPQDIINLIGEESYKQVTHLYHEVITEIDNKLKLSIDANIINIEFSPIYFINNNITNILEQAPNVIFKDQKNELQQELDNSKVISNEIAINNIITRKERNLTFDRKIKNYVFTSLFRNSSTIKTLLQSNQIVKVFFLSTGSHIILIIINELERIITIFDPSYNSSTRKNEVYVNWILKYSNYPYDNFTFSFFEVNIQNKSDTIKSLDLFCKVWVRWYIYYNFVANASKDQIQLMIDESDKNNIQKEIKLFMLRFIKDDTLTKIANLQNKIDSILQNKMQGGGSINFYNKYKKYKGKYLQIKHNKN